MCPALTAQGRRGSAAVERGASPGTILETGLKTIPENAPLPGESSASLLAVWWFLNVALVF